MPFKLKKEFSSPYLIGGLIGLLLLILLHFGATLGTCSGVNKVAAFVSYLISSEWTLKSPFFVDLIISNPIFNGSLGILFGIFLGVGAISYFLGSKPKDFHSIWTRRFGKSKFKRHLGAFIGGFILMFGVRLGGGCLTGHAFSGLGQLSLVSIVFILFMALSSLSFAFLIYTYPFGGKK